MRKTVRIHLTRRESQIMEILHRRRRATVEDLQAVDGVGDARARGVREGLSRLAEASILERYV